MSRLTSPLIFASVGRFALNNEGDVRIVQELLNDKRLFPLLPVNENGVCDEATIAAIVEFQIRVMHMTAPDGFVDPTSMTFRALGADPSVPPIPSGPIAPSVPKPTNMRETAWRYVLEFTKKHEAAVFHMYNNRKVGETAQDVTCGIGFRIESREAAKDPSLKKLFPDSHGNLPSDPEMQHDWDEAAKLSRTDKNLQEYAKVCILRMKPDLVYDRMANILKEKLTTLLSQFHKDFGDFENFPAAAQVFSVSFAYGRLPFDFPKMRESIAAKRWSEAADRCHVSGQDESKNVAHAALLRFAQRIQDAKGDFDDLPPML